MSAHSSSRPGATSHHAFTFLRIENGVHFRNVEFKLPPNLVTIMGGRGTGKSTLLLTLLFAIGYPLPKDKLETVAATLGAGRATAGVCTRHGVTYVASRQVGEEPHVTTADGKPVAVSLDSLLFRAEFYGQKQIEFIGRNPASQLELLDRFVHDDVQRILGEIAAVQRRLERAMEDLRRLEGDIAEDELREQELPTVQAALAGLAPAPPGAPEAEVAKRAEDARLARGRERAGVLALGGEIAKARAALEAFAQGAKQRLAAAIDPALERGANGPLLAQVSSRALWAAGAVEAASAQLRAELARAEGALEGDARALATAHAAQETDYQALLGRLDTDRTRAAERVKLQDRAVLLSAAVKRLEERRAVRAALEEETNRLVDHLVHLRAEHSRLREETSRRITEEAKLVQLSIQRAKGTGAFFDLLSEILAGANIRPAELIRVIAESIPPHVLAADAVANDPSHILAVDEAKTGKEERAAKILKRIRESGRLFDLRTTVLDDVPDFRLRVDGALLPTSMVSDGERCTAVLTLTVLQSPSVLIIDQPEDHLDNAYVFDVFVPAVRRMKLHRQIIFTSHNPNISLLGDSELVLGLRKNASGGYAHAAGPGAEVTGEIERTGEGGREAFLRRAERYGHAPPRPRDDEDHEGRGDDG
jgi:hypothetical protein